MFKKCISIQNKPKALQKFFCQPISLKHFIFRLKIVQKYISIKKYKAELQKCSANGLLIVQKLVKILTRTTKVFIYTILETILF